MPSHKEIRIVPFTVEQMYNLVADIAAYPEFLPWVAEAHIYHEKEDSFYADLVIGYKLLSLSYTSHVTQKPHHIIKVRYVQGPLKYLENIWKFKPISDTHCEIDFYVNFEFNQPILKLAMEAIFREAVNVMVESFEKRAKQIYS